MPVNGKPVDWYALKHELVSSVSGSHSGDGTGNYAHSATMSCGYEDSATTVATSYIFTAVGNATTGAWSVNYTGPGFPLGTVFSDTTGGATVTVSIEFGNVKVYDDGSVFSITYDYTVIVQGVTRATGSDSLGGYHLSPSSLPLLGMPMYMSGGATATTTGLPAYAADDVYSYNSSATGTATGSMTYKETSSDGYTALPIAFISPSVPGFTGGCVDPGLGEIEGETTNDVTITSYYEHGVTKTLYDSGQITECCVVVICDGIEIQNECTVQDPPADWAHYETEEITINRGANCYLLPNLEKLFKPFNPTDFSMLMFRYKMPLVQSAGVASCDDNGVTVVNTDTVDVYAQQSEILQHVTTFSEAMFDTLAPETWAPQLVSGSHIKTLTYTSIEDPVICPGEVPCGGVGTSTQTLVGYRPAPDDESYTGSKSFTFPSSVASSSNMAGYLGHTNALVRYLNTWPNPHWSYALWTDSWDVDGSAKTWMAYWRKVGSQWLNNSAASIAVDIRNHLPSEPLENDGHTTFLQSNLSGLRWAGISRFIAREVVPKSSYTYGTAHSSLWSSSEGSVSLSSTEVTVSPSGSFTGDVELSLTIGSFTVEPYLWPHLADKITCNWTDSNIDTCLVYLEGADGTRVLLNNNQPNVAIQRPIGTTTEFAGSWAQDYGAGSITDQGTDENPPTGGVSSTVVADAHRSLAFQMLADRTAKYLVYVITPVDSGQPVVVKQPKFEYTKSPSRKIIPENAHQAAIIHPDGPGVRCGQWDTGTSGTVNNPPSVYDPTERANIVDGWITARLLVEGEHDVSLTTDLTTYLTATFDSTQGNSVGQVRGDSHWFWLPNNESTNWNQALVDSLSEVPPLALFPTGERNIKSWQTDGDPVQHSWIWAQGPDYFISARTPVSLFYSPDTWTGTPIYYGGGWAVTSHSHAVDNTETGADIIQASTDLADVRPFRGHYVVAGFGNTLGPGNWNLFTPYNHFHRVYTGDEESKQRRSLWPIPSFETDNGIGAWENVVISYNENINSIYATGEFEDDCYGANSTDEGETYGAWELILSNVINSHNVHSPDGYILVTGFRYDSGTSGPGTIVGKTRGPGDTAYSSEFTLEDSSGDIAVEDHRHCISSNGNLLVLTCTKSGDTGPTEYYSADLGQTWTEVV